MAEDAGWLQVYGRRVEPHILREVRRLSGPEQRECTHQGSSSKTVLEGVLELIPKVDLHSHLNGSISAPLLARTEKQLCGSDSAGAALFFSGQGEGSPHALSNASGSDHRGTDARESPRQRMLSCFRVFDNIYRIMTSISFTRLAVQDMLLSSAAESVLVLEIRSSLRTRMTWRHDEKGLRDGTQPGSGGTATGSALVTKKDYLEAILSTVEHVLSGGLVDFDSGELLPILGDDSGRAVPPARWWRGFTETYGFLLPEQHLLSSPIEKAETMRRDGVFAVLYARLREHLTQHMHVRLTPSINRGGLVMIATETVALTRALQQEQVHAFHQWCLRRTRREVLTRLRRTCWVTGCDFSGNCYKGDYREFEVPLKQARADCSDTSCDDAVYGWKNTCPEPWPPARVSVTVHGGEKKDPEELDAMVRFRPDRWGHLVFTDSHHLARILAAHDPMELCITSNLLTSGHAEVSQHHLATIWSLWLEMTSSSTHVAPPPPSIAGALCSPGSGTYTASEERRLHRRLCLRWEKMDHVHADRALVTNTSSSSTAAIPNVSFHTDDRGVFGTTVSHELYLATQHPAFCGGNFSNARAEGQAAEVVVASIRTAVKSMWALQRLALTQVFEIPWPVLLLATLLVAGSPMVPSFHVRGNGSHPLDGTDWREWPVFVQQCEAVLSAEREQKQPCPRTRRALSQWEWQWLTCCFDGYNVGRECPPAAAL